MLTSCMRHPVGFPLDCAFLTHAQAPTFSSLSPLTQTPLVRAPHHHQTHASTRSPRSKFMGPAAVTRVVAEDGGSIGVGAAVGIALGCLAGLVLLLGGGYALYRYRAYQALLPKVRDCV